MRQFDPQFEAHIKSGATTLCSCWLITKKNDVALGFTDHDQILSFDGVQFMPTAGFSPSATVQKGESAVDTSDVMGWLDDDRIQPAHIRDGQFAGATVDTFKVNWRDPSIRHHFRRDYIGEIVERDGVFKAELRSQHVLLNQARGRLFQRSCNAEFGDGACKLNAQAPEYSNLCSMDQITEQNALVVSGLGSRDIGWANGGQVKWLTGQRKNKVMRVLRHDKTESKDVLYLDSADHELSSVGDQLRVTIGCDKRFSTCKEKFANYLNFQGFPHIPGEAFILKYPSADNPLDGRVLVE